MEEPFLNAFNPARHSGGGRNPACHKLRVADKAVFGHCPTGGRTDMTTSHLTDKTTSHSTRLSKDDNQVAGYNPAKDAGQVIGYSHSTKLAMALHSQLTNSSEDHE